MTQAEKQLIVDLAEACEYRCCCAYDAALRGRFESSQENLDWAAMHAESAFFVARMAA